MENATLENYVINLIIDKLDSLEDQNVYGSDLAYNLLEEYNYNGSITYNTFKAKEWIKTYFHELGDIINEMVDSYGNSDSIHDPFNESEMFMTGICIYIADMLCNRLDLEDSFILDSDKIKELTGKLEKLKGDN